MYVKLHKYVNNLESLTNKDKKIKTISLHVTKKHKYL